MAVTPGKFALQVLEVPWLLGSILLMRLILLIKFKPVFNAVLHGLFLAIDLLLERRD